VNSRLDTLQAAILLPKLTVLDDEIAARQKVADRYTRLLNEAAITTTPHIKACNQRAWAQYTVQVDNRDRVQERLKQVGIPTAVHYPIPLNRQPAVADATVQLPVGDRVAQRVLSLPMHPSLELDQISRVVSALHQAL
jgi:UDP-2-acetamido-2-deoxy-ribo-hexuluronate aminotransferase